MAVAVAHAISDIFIKKDIRTYSSTQHMTETYHPAHDIYRPTILHMTDLPSCT